MLFKKYFISNTDGLLRVYLTNLHIRFNARLHILNVKGIFDIYEDDGFLSIWSTNYAIKNNDTSYKKYVNSEIDALIYCFHFGKDEELQKLIYDDILCFLYCYYISDEPEVRYKIKDNLYALVYCKLLNNKDITMKIRSLPYWMKKIINLFRTG